MNSRTKSIAGYCAFFTSIGIASFSTFLLADTRPAITSEKVSVLPSAAKSPAIYNAIESVYLAQQKAAQKAVNDCRSDIPKLFGTLDTLETAINNDLSVLQSKQSSLDTCQAKEKDLVKEWASYGPHSCKITETGSFWDWLQALAEDVNCAIAIGGAVASLGVETPGAVIACAYAIADTIEASKETTITTGQTCYKNKELDLLSNLAALCVKPPQTGSGSNGTNPNNFLETQIELDNQKKCTEAMMKKVKINTYANTLPSKIKSQHELCAKFDMDLTDPNAKLFAEKDLYNKTVESITNCWGILANAGSSDFAALKTSEKLRPKNLTTKGIEPKRFIALSRYNPKHDMRLIVSTLPKR